MQACTKCSRVETVQDPNPVCNMCQVVLCASCADISATEARVFRLQKYRLRFFCSNCEPLISGFIGQSQDRKDEEPEIKSLYREVIRNKDQIITDKQKIIDVLEDKIIMLMEKRPSKYSEILSKNVGEPVQTQYRSEESRKQIKADTRSGKSLKEKSSTEGERNTRVSGEEDVQSLTKEIGKDRGDDWTVVSRRKAGKIIHGSGELTEKFTAIERKAWFFVGRVAGEADADDIRSYVEEKLSGRKAVCEKLLTKSTDGCFKVGVSFDDKNHLEQDTFWPKGIKVKQFRFFRGQPN